MKILILLLSVFFFNIVHAEVGSVKSFFTPSQKLTDDDGDGDGSEQKIVHLFLQNDCNQDVYIATRSENPNGVWETKGYMRVWPGQIIPNGDMVNNIYYLNAYTGDRRVRWEGEHSFEIHGRNVRALLVELPKDYSGTWTTVLFCR